MKANELRIGNKVSFEGSIVTVNTISDDEVTFSDYASFDYPQIEDISGIELTEEWLVRFGGYYLDDDNEFIRILILNSIKIHSKKSDNFSIAEMFIGVDIKFRYVHQLQNLYFALTGEELKTKQA